MASFCSFTLTTTSAATPELFSEAHWLNPMAVAAMAPTRARRCERAGRSTEHADRPPHPAPEPHAQDDDERRNAEATAHQRGLDEVADEKIDRRITDRDRDGITEPELHQGDKERQHARDERADRGNEMQHE